MGFPRAWVTCLARQPGLGRLSLGFLSAASAQGLGSQGGQSCPGLREPLPVLAQAPRILALRPGQLPMRPLHSVGAPRGGGDRLFFLSVFKIVHLNNKCTVLTIFMRPV